MTSIRCFALLSAFLIFETSVSPICAQIKRVDVIGAMVADPTDVKYAPIDDAIALFLAGDAPEAEAQLDAAVKADPGLPPAKVLLAQLYFGVGNVASARVELEHALTTDPATPEPYVMFAELALAEGRRADAEALFRRSLRLAQSLTEFPVRQRGVAVNAYVGVAQVAASREHWANAEANAAAALPAKPDEQRALALIARAQFHQQKFTEAYATFQKLHQANPATLLPEINMGLLYEELVEQGDAGKRESAKRAMEAAVKKAPQDLSVRLMVGRWAMEACEPDLAQDNAKAALELNPASVEALLLAGAVARVKGDLETAELALQSAHIRSPLSEASRMLALVLIESEEAGQQRLALEYAQLATRAYPDTRNSQGAFAAATLAFVLARSGRTTEAMQILGGVPNAANLTGEAAWLAFQVMQSAGQTESAAKLLQAAVNNPPCYPGLESAKKLAE